MAERTAVTSYDEENQARVEWTGLLTTDTGSWVRVPRLSDKCIQVSGATGTGGLITFEGTNEVSPLAAETIVATMRDAFSNAALSALTVNDMRQVGEHPLWVRPVVTGGDGGTNFKVAMNAVGKRR